VPASALEHMRSNTPNVRKPRRVAPSVWHATEEAIESVIVSDQFEQYIFLIRFPFSLTIEHAEEPEQDAFTVLAEKAQGLNWKT
ncbi:MAG: hypothetical protein KGZ83_17505, partial [Sulfuricella sp.]|nr:hypothetical protein [Sulfuricella sp.]